jgi:hypothetical protein
MAQFNDENQAKQTIERWRASGLGVIPFTKHEGISVWRFYQMRKMVDVADPCIVPVVVRPVPIRERTLPASPFEVELASGMKIRVAAGFDAAELVRLVEALAGVRC